MRIAQVLGGDAAWGGLTLDRMGKGLGGRETALLRLGMAWADQGHEVDCYVPREGIEFYDGKEGVMALAPQKGAVPNIAMDRYDAVVLWECPELLTYNNVECIFGKTYVEFQVAHVPYEHTAVMWERCAAVCGLSPWHNDFLASQIENKYPDLAGRIKYRVTPNGVRLQDFHPQQERTRDLFYYASSPDRGLSQLLRAWPVIKSERPTAELHVFYGATEWAERNRWSHNKQGEMAVHIIEGLKQAGVIDQGKVGQHVLADMASRAEALLYPCDTMQPTETGCITVLEAMAGGSVVFTTDCDCLGSEFSHVAHMNPLPLDPTRWAAQVLDTLEAEDHMDEYRIKGLEFVEQHRSWDHIARSWIEMFEETA